MAVIGYSGPMHLEKNVPIEESEEIIEEQVIVEKETKSKKKDA